MFNKSDLAIYEVRGPDAVDYILADDGQVTCAFLAEDFDSAAGQWPDYNAFCQDGPAAVDDEELLLAILENNPDVPELFTPGSCHRVSQYDVDEPAVSSLTGREYLFPYVDDAGAVQVSRGVIVEHKRCGDVTINYPDETYTYTYTYTYKINTVRDMIRDAKRHAAGLPL